MIDDILHRYAGPAWSWMLNLGLMLFDGIHPMTALATLGTIWWTIERALSERARRRTEEAREQVYTEYVDEARKSGGFRRLMDRLTTRRGDL